MESVIRTFSQCERTVFLESEKSTLVYTVSADLQMSFMFIFEYQKVVDLSLFTEAGRNNI